MMWDKYKDVEDICFCVQTNEYQDWDCTPGDPTDQYEAMRMAYERPYGQVAVIEHSSTDPVCIDIINKDGMWETKYVFIDDATDSHGVYDVKAYDTEKEAIETADCYWHHLTKNEQQKRTGFRVSLGYWDEESEWLMDELEVIRDFKIKGEIRDE